MIVIASAPIGESARLRHQSEMYVYYHNNSTASRVVACVRWLGIMSSDSVAVVAPPALPGMETTARDAGVGMDGAGGAGAGAAAGAVDSVTDNMAQLVLEDGTDIVKDGATERFIQVCCSRLQPAVGMS